MHMYMYRVSNHPSIHIEITRVTLSVETSPSSRHEFLLGQFLVGQFLNLSVNFSCELPETDLVEPGAATAEIPLVTQVPGSR